MVTRVLAAGAVAALLIQAPFLLHRQMSITWFYLMPLAAVCLFLCAMALAAFRVNLPLNMTVAAAGVAYGYVVLVSPARILSPGWDFVATSMGVGCLVVLGYRLAREIRSTGGRRGWLLLAAGIAGGVVLGQAGARRYAAYVTSQATPIADAVAWAWYMSGILAFGAVLALAGRAKPPESVEPHNNELQRTRPAQAMEPRR